MTTDSKSAGPSDNEFRSSVCRLGHGSLTCSFLILSPDGFECAKGTSLEMAIVARRPGMNAKGDNCSGAPLFEVSQP